jgi:hypothetical protein
MTTNWFKKYDELYKQYEKDGTSLSTAFAKKMRDKDLPSIKKPKLPIDELEECQKENELNYYGGRA